MSRIERWLAAWVERTSARESGETLAVVRILVAVALLVNLVGTARSGAAGLFWVDQAYGGTQELSGNWLVGLLGGPTPTVVWSLIALGCLAACSLLLGLGARVAALVAGQALVALSGLSSNATGSYDPLMTNALWILVFADSGTTWSLACRWRHGAWSSATMIPRWPREVLVIQVVVIYFAAGIQKASVAWVPGGDLSAVYYIAQMPSWQRGDMTWLATPFAYTVTQIATLGTWLFEVSFPIVLLSPALGGRRLDARRVYVAVGLMMHAGIAAFLAVGPFVWIMPAFYAALFRPEELGAWFSRREAGDEGAR